MAQTVSYESLADTALQAALEIQRARGADQLENLGRLVSMLRDPVENNNGYKLLTDARNLPVYRAAWENAGMPARLKQDVLLDRISEFLSKSVELATKPGSAERDRLYQFCLALNRLFLEKSATRLIQSRTTRIDALA